MQQPGAGRANQRASRRTQTDERSCCAGRELGAGCGCLAGRRRISRSVGCRIARSRGGSSSGSRETRQYG